MRSSSTLLESFCAPKLSRRKDAALIGSQIPRVVSIRETAAAAAVWSLPLCCRRESPGFTVAQEIPGGLGCVSLWKQQMTRDRGAFGGESALHVSEVSQAFARCVPQSWTVRKSRLYLQRGLRWDALSLCALMARNFGKEGAAFFDAQEFVFLCVCGLQDTLKMIFNVPFATL